MTETEIIEKLVKKFPYLDGTLSSPTKMRVFTGFLPPEKFEEIIRYVHDGLDFFRGHHIIGTDEGEDIGMAYLLSGKDNIMLILREKVPKSNPKIKCMSGLYPAMLMHERELVDLFGVQVEGLPDGPNYPLPDGWPKGQYPMRKEWNPQYFNKATLQYEPPTEAKEAAK